MIFILAFRILNAYDFIIFISWCLSFSVFAIVASPLSERLFPFSPDKGWLYGHALGLIATALPIWILSYLGLPVFTPTFIRVFVIVLCTLVLFIKYRKLTAHKKDSESSEPRTKDKERETITLLNKDKDKSSSYKLFASLIFITAFLIWTYFRSLKPEAYGLEKVMDYGYMMSLWRSKTLPAPDIWLAGKNINYYYFGHYIFTFISKLTGVNPAYSYNLSMSASFALTLSLGYAVVRDALIFRLKISDQDNITRLLDSSEEFTRAEKRSENSENLLISNVLVKESKNQKNLNFLRYDLLSNLGALLAALLLTIAGNSHAFFYKPGQIGNSFVKYLANMGIEVGQTAKFFFADSTRFIGHNPETQDMTIHEFPYYSYIVSDLHAHMINLSFVLLFLGVLLSFIYIFRQLRLNLSLNTSLKSELKLELTSVHQWTLAILAAVFMMTNYWDFAIYFVIYIITIFMINTASMENSGGFINFFFFLIQLSLYFIPFLSSSLTVVIKLLAFALALALSAIIYNYSKSAWTKTGLAGAFMFFIAHLVSLTFDLKLDPMPKVISLSEKHSSFYQLFILWFFHISLAIIFSIYIFISNRKQISTDFKAKKGPFKTICNINRIDIFKLILGISAIGLIILPELVYVKDIYGGSYTRANTMFKFTYQAFSLLSLLSGYFITSLLQNFMPQLSKDLELKTDKLSNIKGKSSKTAEVKLNMPKRFSGEKSNAEHVLQRWNYSILPLFLILVFTLTIPFAYTNSAKDWYGDMSLTSSGDKSLEASSYYATLSINDIEQNWYGLSDRLNIINFLNDYEKGQENILEAYGKSYSEYSVTSAYTGLPTVLGWETHEWLWRTNSTEESAYFTVVLPLQEAIDKFYNESNLGYMQDFIDKYKIKYIIVGELERIKFHTLDENIIKSLGNVIYTSGNDYIVEVTELPLG